MKLRFLTLLCVALLAGVSVAHAEISIGVVDTRALVSESKASKDISKQLKKHRDSVLKELSKKEQDLIEEEKNLVEAKKKLQEEDFIKQAKEFEKNRIALQKLSDEYRQKLNAAALEAEKGLMTEIVKVVQKIAADKAYDLVITKQNVIVGAVEIDLTEEAMKILNKEVPSYKVKYDK